MSIAPSNPSQRVWAAGCRVLAAMGIGVLATVAGCLTGAMMLILIGVFYHGLGLVEAAPGFAVYGVILGWLFAWPTTLLVLPAVWLFLPDRKRLIKRVVLLSGGMLTGGFTLVWMLVRETGSDVLNWSMVAAGVTGGLAAGVVFALFVPRRTPPVLRSHADSPSRSLP